VVFLDGSSCTNAVVERCVLHAFHNSFATRIDFFWIIASEGSRNGRSVVHPAFQFELSHNFVFAVWFRPTLGDLVSSHVGFVEIVDKIDGKFDQEIALHLGVVGIIDPIVEVSLRSKPQHGVSAVLHPKGLLPFFHHDSAKGNSRQDKPLLADEFGLWKSRSPRSYYLLGKYISVGIGAISVLIIPVIVVSAVGGRYHLTITAIVSVRLIVRRGIGIGI